MAGLVRALEEAAGRVNCARPSINARQAFAADMIARCTEIPRRVRRGCGQTARHDPRGGNRGRFVAGGLPVRQLLVRWNVIDQPNARSSHQPVARGGGLGIMLVFFGVAAGLLAAGTIPPSRPFLALLTATLIVAVISFGDDLKPQPSWLRFGCHALAAMVLITALGWPVVSVSWDAAAGFALPPWVGHALLFLWLVGYVNGFNFMDGINGLAAGQAMLTGAGTAMIGGLAGRLGRRRCCWRRWWPGRRRVSCRIIFPGADVHGGCEQRGTGIRAGRAGGVAGTGAGVVAVDPPRSCCANFILDTGITLGRRLLEESAGSHTTRAFYQRWIGPENPTPG